jgi:phosphotransferase system enzyme I (PtsI)
MNGPYFRERVRDLDDSERRVLKARTGFGGCAHLELKSPSIIVADDLTPTETVQLPREYVLGFATNGGSTTSHVALLARALAIPAVSGLGDITARVKPGQTMLLDGTNGTVTLNPDIATQREFADLIERQLELAEAVVMGPPAGTFKDGGKILLYANVHPGVPLEGIRENGARGIGLYRSEYLWLHKELEPTEEEQFAAYSEAARFAGTLSPDGAAVIRVLDIGGDKLVRGISSKEANPFLGNRSIRYLLSHRDVLRTQVRAILRASAFGRVKILCPMISCVEEMREVEREIAGVKRALEAEGLAFDGAIPVGAMIEVPSAALNADALARHADFFSIGTNDLVQYTMAADRGNEAVANLYQPMNPAVVRLVRMTLDAARARGIDVCVCGESASDPVVGLYWAALGVGELSMSAPYIPVISKCLSCLSRADLDAYAAVPETLPRDASADEIYAACRAWLVSKIGDAGGEWL